MAVKPLANRPRTASCISHPKMSKETRNSAGSRGRDRQGLLFQRQVIHVAEADELLDPGVGEVVAERLEVGEIHELRNMWEGAIVELREAQAETGHPWCQ